MNPEKTHLQLATEWHEEARIEMQGLPDNLDKRPLYLSVRQAHKNHALIEVKDDNLLRKLRPPN